MGSQSGQGDKQSSRQKRLADALRANLKRRKARERQRSSDSPGRAGGNRNKSAKESG